MVNLADDPTNEPVLSNDLVRDKACYPEFGALVCPGLVKSEVGITDDNQPYAQGRVSVRSADGHSRWSVEGGATGDMKAHSSYLQAEYVQKSTRGGMTKVKAQGYTDEDGVKGGSVKVSADRGPCTISGEVQSDNAYGAQGWVKVQCDLD